MKFYTKCPQHHRRSLYKRFSPESLVCMPVCDAQLTSVTKVEHLISDTEIDAILHVVQESRLPAYTSSAEEDVGSDGNPIHTTTYLQTDNIFETKLPWLHRRLLTVVRRINTINKWGFDINSRSALSVRVAEYHEMRVGGVLRNAEHYDIGSLVTVDIMLKEAAQGAAFRTLETTVQNPADSSNIYLRTHPFEAGDALVFVSHKYHCVSPLTEGSRKVLVIEFWTGKKRSCGHRCDIPFKECNFVDC